MEARAWLSGFSGLLISQTWDCRVLNQLLVSDSLFRWWLGPSPLLWQKANKKQLRKKGVESLSLPPVMVGKAQCWCLACFYLYPFLFRQGPQSMGWYCLSQGGSSLCSLTSVETPSHTSRGVSSGWIWVQSNWQWALTTRGGILAFGHHYKVIKNIGLWGRKVCVLA